MEDDGKTKKQLVDELTALRQRVVELESREAEGKRAEERLYFQSSLVDNASDSIVAMDANMVIKSWNAASEVLYGWSAEEMIGRRANELVQTYFMGITAEEISQQLIDTGVWKGEVIQTRRDGVKIPVQVSQALVKDRQGKLVGYVAINRDISERKRADEVLRESERRFRDLFANLPVACWTYDGAGTILDWNRSSEELYGWSADQVIGKTMYELMVKDENVAATQDKIAAVFQGQSFRGLEYQDRRADGTTCDVLVNEYPLKDSSGRIIMGVCAELDVTERKRAEQALRESEERFRFAMEAASDGIWDLDIRTDKTYYSPGYYQILGYEPGGFPLIAQEWSERIHPDDLENALKINSDCIENRTQSFEIEFRMQAKSGEWKWILSRGKAVSRGADGKALRMIGTHVDITARKQAEQALRDSEERFRLFFELAPIGMAITLLDGRYIRVNQAFCKLLEYTPEEMLGLKWQEISYPDPGEIEQNLREREKLIQKQASDFQMERRYFSKTRKLIHTVLHVTLVRDAQDEPVYFLGQIVDITQRKLLEAQVLRSEKLAGLGTLAAGVAHELNSPLQVITGLSESAGKRIRRGEIDPERLSQNLEIIRNNGWRCAEIVRSLLAFAQPDVERSERHALNVVVGDTLLLIGHQLHSWQDITVTTYLAPDLPPLLCDRNQIAQVLIHLVNNAADAMPGGGEITIRTGYDEARRCLTLQVSDTGSGMTEEVKAKIFDPFFTTKEVGKGSGLGLFTVQGIVQAHGGDIEVESAEKKGTTFTVYLPEEAAAQPPTASNSEEAEDQTGRYRIG